MARTLALNPARSLPSLTALRVAIIASGKDYQEAAAWAAPTYVRQMSEPNAVSVLVPQREALLDLLRARSQQFGFGIVRFPFRTISPRKFTSQLKCQAFWFAVSRLGAGEILFIVDADTYCLKPLVLDPNDQRAILEGKIGLAPDIADRHFRTPADPWYLAPHERTTYVNSGVIVASRKSRPLFTVFRRLSERRSFLHGPFNDQKVINYALGKHFRHKLVVLDRIYNGIRRPQSEGTLIGHCAGGAGRLGSHARKLTHLAICKSLLRR